MQNKNTDPDSQEEFLEYYEDILEFEDHIDALIESHIASQMEYEAAIENLIEEQIALENHYGEEFESTVEDYLTLESEDYEGYEGYDGDDYLFYPHVVDESHYEMKYDNFENIPQNIDYDSWYEFDNFQDYLSGKDSFDFSDAPKFEEERYLKMDGDFFDFDEDFLDFDEDAYLAAKMPEDLYLDIALDFDEDAYIESIMSDDDAYIMPDEDLEKEFLLSVDYDEEMRIDGLIDDYLEDEMKQELEMNHILEENARYEESLKEQIESYDENSGEDYLYEDFIDDIDFDYEDSLEDLYYKSLNVKKQDEEDKVDKAFYYGDYPFDE